MSFLRKEIIINGDYLEPFYIFKCDKCGEELPENYPRENFFEEDKDYCGDCSFKMGIISEQEYLDNYCFWIGISGLRAVVHDGEIHLGTGKFEWERSSRNRESKTYREWREQVFLRDDWTCQNCGKRGGILNAHHIKEYAKYPKLRTDITNGITLCEECHKKEHKRRKATIDGRKKNVCKVNSFK